MLAPTAALADGSSLIFGQRMHRSLMKSVLQHDWTTDLWKRRQRGWRSKGASCPACPGGLPNKRPCLRRAPSAAGAPSHGPLLGGVPSPVQVVARGSGRAPGGGGGVLGQLREAEPRRGLLGYRALLPLIWGRLQDGLGGHCCAGTAGRERTAVRGEGKSPRKLASLTEGRDGGGNQ